MNGKLYANLFVHFIPVDHDKINELDHTAPKTKQREGGHEASNHDPTPGQTTLHFAAASGNEVAVKQILDKGTVDINSRDNNGWQPLHEAVHAGHLRITKLLISRGADIASKTNSGGTALWWYEGCSVFTCIIY